jgi:hypothetical protein
MLLAAVGKTVEVYALRPGQGQWPSLVKTAFYDLPLLVTSFAAVKDFLVVGDIHHGVSFLRYTHSDSSTASSSHRLKTKLLHVSLHH